MVDPDETARYKPFHVDLHCLRSVGLGLPGKNGLSRFFLLIFFFLLQNFSKS